MQTFLEFTVTQKFSFWIVNYLNSQQVGAKNRGTQIKTVSPVKPRRTHTSVHICETSVHIFQAQNHS